MLVRIMRRVRSETRAFIKNRSTKKKIRHLLRGRKEIFLECGAGDKIGQNGWITIDLTEQCDIYWDLNNGIPFPSESVSKIYSSHFLEHLSFKQGQAFLEECRRVLIPGGVFSICVPNARIFIEAYSNPKPLADAFFGYKPAYSNTTKIDCVNYIAYMDDHHKYMFDEENLLQRLESKRFKNVRLREFDPNLDLKERDLESIYAEANK